ncbi:MAG: ribosome silencing factor [Thermomicrobiales bacterium]|nr:ribosome silencing factor [Thermomicrobiales bacterium]MCO5221704.1 ribosome silencing factor [Thermomicrobiales bacterium]
MTDTAIDTNVEHLDASRELALQIADVLSETPASDTVVLDIRGLSSFADFFVICSGENERQLRAITERLQEEFKERGIRPQRVEGTPRSGWIVLDYNDVIVHVFDAELRDFYKMERLWAEAPRLLAIQ